MLTFTPIEQAIVNILDDGLRHRREELLPAIPDPEATLDNTARHVSRIRHKLRTIGHDVVCEYYNGTFWYRHVVLYKNSNRD